MIRLALIVAAAENGVIGRNNALPWYLPEDLRYFKRVTMGKPIIMGRKTFASIGKPLPGRTNIVVTRQKNWSFAGVLVAKSVKEALEFGQQFRNEQGKLAEEVMVIGGAEIYRHALEVVLGLGRVRKGIVRHEVHLRANGRGCSASGLFGPVIWLESPILEQAAKFANNA